MFGGVGKKMGIFELNIYINVLLVFIVNLVDEKYIVIFKN